MSHIDEGELTAYADGAYAADDPVAQRIRMHLAECANCRNRLQQASELTARAGEVLAYAAPLAMTVPPFEEIRAAAATRPRRRVFVPAAWAASIVMAVGLGWFAHSMTIPERAQEVASAPNVAEPAPAVMPAPQPATAEQHEEQLAVQQPKPRSTPDTVTRLASAERNAAQAKVADQPAEVAADAVQGNIKTAAAPPPAAAALPPSTLALETHVIPGLNVASIRAAGDSVIIEQKLADGKVVTLLSTTVPEAQLRAFREEPVTQQAGRVAKAQRAAAVAPEAAPVAAPANLTVTVTRGTRRITVSGPLSLDSLRALAEKIR